MKLLAQLNYELKNGYVPEQLYYVKPIEDRRLFIKRFPKGFMSLPNADLIIDRMMFEARLSHIIIAKMKQISDTNIYNK